MKKMNKKGVFFTVLVIALLVLFLVTYSFASVIKDRKPVRRRIETMNSFVDSVEKDLPRQLYISGFRTIFLIEKEILDTGNYINNFNATVEELFYNGSVDGVAEELMRGANFSGMQGFLNSKAEKINADVTLENPELKVTQDDPWNVKFSLTVDMMIVDKTNLSSWNRTQTIDAYIPINSFEDPIYIVETSNVVTNKINQTSYRPFVNGSDVSNLSFHLANSSYIESSSAPSFLQRLEGNFDASANGIESLVYLPTLSSQGIPIEDKCIVDYIYFSDDNPSPLYRTSGMQSWFKLDDAHRDLYEVRDISYEA
jgi:hypothetical protein